MPRPHNPWVPRAVFATLVFFLVLYSAKFFARMGLPWIFRMADSAYPNPWPVGIPVSHRFWLFPYSPMIQATLLLMFLLALFFRRKLSRGYATFTAGFLLSFLIEMYGIAFSAYAVHAAVGDPIAWEPFRPPGESLLFQHVLRFPSLVVGWMAGIYLIWNGWSEIHKGGDRLVTTGIYARIRHPQYVGLFLIALGVLLFCPTPLQLLLFVILVGMYLRLSRVEDREMAAIHGQAFERYRARVPAFLPWLGRRAEG